MSFDRAADIQDMMTALTGPDAALLYRKGSFTYLAFSTTRAASSECDACGKRIVRGFDVMFLGRLDCCLTTGLWLCSTTCLRSKLTAKEVGG